MTKSATLPLDDALDATQFIVETHNGKTLDLLVVDADETDTDAYVGDRYGGTEKRLTAESHDLWKGTCVFGVRIAAPKYSDTARINIWAKETDVIEDVPIKAVRTKD